MNRDDEFEPPVFETDDGWTPREDIHSVADFNDYYLDLLESYVMWTYPGVSIEPHVYDIIQHPYLAKTVIENWMREDDEKWQMWIDTLALPNPKSRINMFLGPPGSGKSTLAYATAHDIHERSGRPVCEVGTAATRPPFVEQIDRFQDAPYGAVVIDNELALNASSQDGSTKEAKANKSALATIRHQDIIGLFVSQNSTLAQKTFYALADTLAFKPVGLMQAKAERGPMRGIMEYWKELLPRLPDETFLLSRHIPPLKIKREAPEWYTDQISRSYVRFTEWSEVLPIAMRLRAKGDSFEKISSKLEPRFRFEHREIWRRRILEANNGLDPLTGAPPPKRGRPTAADA